MDPEILPAAGSGGCCHGEGSFSDAVPSRRSVLLERIWAHTGSYLPPSAIRDLLREHPNLSFDLSSKNPLYEPRSATHPMLGLGGIDETGRQLFEAYPDRFFLGVDFLAHGMLSRAREVGEYYRRILTQLTPATARKIGYENAVKAFGLG